MREPASDPVNEVTESDHMLPARLLIFAFRYLFINRLHPLSVLTYFLSVFHETNETQNPNNAKSDQADNGSDPSSDGVSVVANPRPHLLA